MTIQVKYDARLNVFIPCWPLRLRKGEGNQHQYLYTPYTGGGCTFDGESPMGNYVATKLDQG